MSRYFIEFSKQGYIKYISHLDLQRLFKRSFRRVGIPIDYSEGYNPHPKMGFVQPLSLGYTTSQDYLEFHTKEPIRVDIMRSELRDVMPQGIDIINIKELDIKPKSLASCVVAAVYEISLPMNYRSRSEDVEKLVNKYMSQDGILAEKREKKTKKMVEVDIKNKIQSISVDKNIDGNIVLIMKLDAGSNSNLSPEQVISSFTKFSQLYLPREDIEVERKYLIFDSCIPQTLGLHLQKPKKEE